MILFLLAFLLLAHPAFPATAVDANSESACTGCSSDSWAHTTTGTNTTLICSPAKTDGRTVSAFTVNSLALTQHATKASSNPDNNLEMWFRIAPTTGAQTVAITLSGAAVMVNGCTSLTDTHQTTPLGTAQFNTNNNDLTTSPPSITVPANGLAYDAVFFINGDDGCAVPTPGGSQTLQLDVCQDNGPNASVIAAASTRATTGTMSWDNLASAFEGQIAVPISPAAAAASGSRRFIVD